MQAKWTVKTVLALLMLIVSSLWAGCNNDPAPQPSKKSGSSKVTQTTVSSGYANGQTGSSGATGPELNEESSGTRRSDALKSSGGSFDNSSAGGDSDFSGSGGGADGVVSEWKLTFVLDSLEVSSGDDCDLGVFEKTEQVTKDLGEKVTDGAGDVKDWLEDKIFGLTSFDFDFPVPDPTSVTTKDLGDFIICVKATHSGNEISVYCPGREHALDSTHWKIGEKKTITVQANQTVDVSVEVYDQDLVSKEKLINENLTIYTPQKRSDPEAKNKTMKSVGQYETCKATLYYGISWEPVSG